MRRAHLRNRRVLRRWLSTLVLILIALLLQPIIWVILDGRFYNFFQAKRAVPEWRSVVLVEIDRRSRDTVFTRPVFPLSRHLREHTGITRRLAEAGAKAVVFDIELSEDSFSEPPDSLAATFRWAGNVYLPLSLRASTSSSGAMLTVARRPDSTLVSASQGAYVVDVPLDPDGTVRRFYPYPGLDRLGLETLPERLAECQVSTPVPILFPSVGRRIPSVSYADVLAGDLAALDMVSGRVAIIAMSGEEAQDFVTVPGLQDLGDGTLAYGLPGGAILAATMETLIQGAPLRDAPRPVVVAWLLLWCLGVVAVLPHRRPVTDVAVMIGWILVALAVTGALHIFGNIILPAGLLLGALLMCGAYALVDAHIDTLNDLHASELQSATMRREMVLARENQERFLPKSMPELPGYDLWGVNISSAVVSGDYYDVLALPERNRVLLAIADVSGKGLPASLVMSNVQAALHSHAMQAEFDLVRAVDSLNALLYRNTDATTFVTMFLGELDCASRRLRYVRAGHDFPVLISGGGSARTLEPGGFFLGMFPGQQYAVEEILMESGDVLGLYTDGVTEARNAQGEEFGVKRLIEVLQAHRHESAESLGLAVRRGVESFSGLAIPEDDVTLLIARMSENGCEETVAGK